MSVGLFLRLSVVCAVGLFTHSTCYATQFVRSKVTKLFSSKSDVYFVYFDGGTVNGSTPTCAGTTTSMKRFAIKPSTVQGRVLISSLMMAQAEGRPVVAVGQGQWTAEAQCTDWGDAESLRNLTVE